MDDIKIIKMEEMRVASFHAMGESPEIMAIEKMQAWARPKGLVDGGKYNVFGFDNPLPEPGKKEYGYEVWVVLDDESIPVDDVEVKQIPATKYAKLYSEGFDNIGSNWRKLADWVKNSDHEHACGQCLEGHYSGSSETGDFALDLLIPIE